MSQHFRVNHALPPQADRRKASTLKGLPLIGGLGVLVIDRRSYLERRKYRRTPNQGPLCALLRWREQGQQHKGFFRKVTLHWGEMGHPNAGDGDLPWLLRWRSPPKTGRLVKLGTWLRQHLRNTGYR